jgi:hypothetical protein
MDEQQSIIVAEKRNGCYDSPDCDRNLRFYNWIKLRVASLGSAAYVDADEVSPCRLDWSDIDRAQSAQSLL